MMKNGNYVQVRRGIMDHIREGRLSEHEALSYISIILAADARNGVWSGSAPALVALLPFLDIYTARHTLLALVHKGYLKSFRVRGQRGNQPIMVNKYLVTMGAYEGKRTNATATTDWREPVFEGCSCDAYESAYENAYEEPGVTAVAASDYTERDAGDAHDVARDVAHYSIHQDTKSNNIPDEKEKTMPADKLAPLPVLSRRYKAPAPTKAAKSQAKVYVPPSNSFDPLTFNEDVQTKQLLVKAEHVRRCLDWHWSNKTNGYWKDRIHCVADLEGALPTMLKHMPPDYKGKASGPTKVVQPNIDKEALNREVQAILATVPQCTVCKDATCPACNTQLHKARQQAFYRLQK